MKKIVWLVVDGSKEEMCKIKEALHKIECDLPEYDFIISPKNVNLISKKELKDYLNKILQKAES